MYWSQYWGRVPVSKKINKRDFAKAQNNAEFMNTFNVFYSLALELFRWSGLPDTCDERMLERMLLLNGQAMICKYQDAYLTLGSAGGYDINVYGYPTKGWGYGLNGLNHQFSVYVPGADNTPLVLETPAGNVVSAAPDAVICYDNAAAYPPILYIMQDAQRLADLVRSTDVAVKTLKTPIIIGVSETEQNSLKQLLDDYDSNVYATLVSRALSLDSIKVWPAQGDPAVIAAIWQQYLNVWSRLLAILGITSNPNEDKKERLLVDEVNANNQYVYANLHKRLEWRRKFCEQVNATFGLDISVDINREVIGDDSGGDMQDDPDDGVGQGDGDTGDDA